MHQFKANTKQTYMQFVDDKYDGYPSIYIMPNALSKMQAYVDYANKEISWLGTVERDINNNIFTITDVMLFPQDTTATTADLCEYGLSAYGSKLLKEGKADVFNSIRMWGHSHVNLTVDPSGTDGATFEQFYGNSEYFIRLIVNKKGDMRIDLMDSETGIMYNNLDWYEIKSPEQLQLEDLIAKFNKEQSVMHQQIKQLVDLDVKHNIDNAEFKKKSTTAQATALTGGRQWSGYEYQVPYVRIHTQTGTLVYRELTQVLTDEEMKLIGENCRDGLMVQEVLTGYDEFKGYDIRDWDMLFEKIQQYYYRSGLYQK